MMNSSFGDTFKKDIDYKHEFKTERWMEMEYVGGVEEYLELQNGGYVVKLEIDEV